MKYSEALWKQRYELLVSHLKDVEVECRDKGFDVCERRAWDPPRRIYVSFCLDVCDSEDHAISEYGEGNYDVYDLVRASPKDIEDVERVRDVIGD